MSYLPRMSKTYKEPEEQTYEDAAKEMTFNNMPIASAVPDEKSFNPHTVLKQYNFYPHPPPQLPGPSLIKEAEENEKVSEDAKRRRLREKTGFSAAESKMKDRKKLPFQNGNEKPVVNTVLVDLSPKLHDEEKKPGSSNKDSKSEKLMKSEVPLRSKATKEDVNKERGKFSGYPGAESAEVTMLNGRESKFVGKPEKSFESDSADEFYFKKESVPASEGAIKQSSFVLNSDTEKVCSRKCEALLVDTLEENAFQNTTKGGVSEGVQCIPNRSSEKITVMPSSVNNLIRTLSFLIQELHKLEQEGSESSPKEMNKLLGHIKGAITALSNHKSHYKFALQTCNSDSKRLERICTDLEQYIKHVYGENGKFGCKSEEKKQIYCKLLQKEYELKVLNEKLRESEIQSPSPREIEQIKSPEVILQNKDLENEQLLAEIEFNSQELKRYQQALAEKNWDIQKSKEDAVAMKKKLTALKSKSKK